ncbi:XRE family transcriptional regulator [Streptomyces sp. NPDC052301]|uniref:XRE family transcriptional regulator n=1 Tax=Streptomyces sp. NPDC052301 TaxID=3365687 RepID=UPI0037D12DC6
MRHPQGSTTPDEPLVAELRELKDGTGLSLAALAARTPYSKSAWHRYLSGGTLPPRQAVEALCGLAGTDPEAVLALWDAAEAAAPADPPEEAAARGRRPRALRRFPPWLPLSALGLLGVATTVAAAVALSGRPATAPAGQPLSAVPHCHGRSCQGESADASVCARDARTAATVTAPGYAVLLRHSPACGTAWAEVRLRSARAREVSVRKGEDVLSAGYPADDSAGNCSPMLSASSPRGVEACAEVDGMLACTGLDVEPDGQG